jgi:FlaA1/EpsC-like NDP-sugar epimerase
MGKIGFDRAARKKRAFHLEHWQGIAVYLAMFDAFAICAAYFLALWIRFDCRFSMIENVYLENYYRFILIYVLVSLLVFRWMHLYNSIWRFASFTEMYTTMGATAVTGVLHVAGMSLLFGRMPMSYYLFGTVLQFAFTLGVRFSYRFILLERSKKRTAGDRKRVMLVGAGNAGQMILQNVMKDANSGLRVCCIIDDNPNKWHRSIAGVPVVGDRDTIMANVKKYRIDKIFIAIPSATREQLQGVLNICKETGCEMKILPGITELVTGNVSVKDMQDVAVEDLLGREPITVNMAEIGDFITGKTILVTGGGGSIGSELCRQVASYRPRQLVIFDVYENNAYEIEQELRRKWPMLDLQVRIGSVRDSRCLERVFSEYTPDIVYHAAAHKHVPLMEASPCEAIKNNVIGTYKTAYAAMCHGCSRFVLISTDKAVNPTNIMGASKRLCEMIIQTFDRAVKNGNPQQLPQLFTHDSVGTRNLPMPENVTTEFVAVRFGNVLGSNGSVIPLFKRQIQSGGPVTVTHPDIVRYFMTIPEAVSLVMQAGTYAGGGEIFVLDMGAPVKIDDLARNLIKLSGLRPDVDIEIVYSGLRPGEKLYEEKLMAEEGLKKTSNKLIHIGCPIPFDEERFLNQLKNLMDAAYENDDAIRDAVAAMVPTYKPAGDVARV